MNVTNRFSSKSVTIAIALAIISVGAFFALVSFVNADTPNTTTTITNDLSVATVVGEPYTVDFTVSGTSTPTGSVTVSDGTDSCGPVALDGAGLGSCSLTSTTAGSKTITASYASDNPGFDNSEGTVSHTVTSDDQLGHLIVHKVTNPTDTQTQFSITLDATPVTGNAIQSIVGGDSVDYTVNNGTYSVSEDVLSGWNETENTCSQIHVGNGETKDCTFTNTKLGSIMVKKDVVSPSGGDASDSHSFTVTLDGGSSQSITEDDSHTYSDLLPSQQYTIAEAQDDDYGDITIGGDCASDGTITLTAGQNAVCTITNKQKQGTLHVIKHVVNHNGLGTAVAADFTMSVDGTNASLGSFLGNEDGTTVTLDPGTYSVGESDRDGYFKSLSGDCTSATTLSNGEKTCTITNSDIPDGQGALTVIKEVVNDNGGGAQVSDFALQLTDSNDDTIDVTSGQANDLEPDTYTVSEDFVNGYTQTGFNCTKDGNPYETDGNEVSIEDDHSYVCTITNDDIAGTISGMKFEDLNGNGQKDQGEPGLRGWTIELKKNSQVVATTTTGANGAYSFFDVFADVYTADEVGQTGWTQMTANPAPITINPGDTVGDVDFGNFHEVTITGLKWDDLNSDGIHQPTEPGLPGVDVQIRRVIHEPVQNILIDTELIALDLTGGGGGFTLHASTPGQHIITETVPSGFKQTHPVQSFFDVFVDTSGATINMGVPHGCQPTPVTTCQPVPLEFGNFRLITRTITTGEASTTTTSTNAGSVTVEIASSTVVTGPIGWDGTIHLPTATSTDVAPVPDSGTTASTIGSIEIGFGDTLLTFDKGVRILFAGQAGKLVGYSHGPGTFTKITTTCSADSQIVGNALPAGGDCKIDVGSDLVVWTKHFSAFTTYTQTATPAPVSSGGGGGGIISGPGSVGYQVPTPSTPIQPVQTQGQVLGASTYNFTINLKIGSKGADVTALQQILIDGGYLSVSAPTGTYGPLTAAAVKKYQVAHGIEQTGTVGPKTRTTLNAGVTPTMSDEQRSTLIAQLQAQLKNLMAQLNALIAARASSGQ